MEDTDILVEKDVLTEYEEIFQDSNENTNVMDTETNEREENEKIGNDEKCPSNSKNKIAPGRNLVHMGSFTFFCTGMKPRRFNFILVIVSFINVCLFVVR